MSDVSEHEEKVEENAEEPVQEIKTKRNRDEDQESPHESSESKKWKTEDSDESTPPQDSAAAETEAETAASDAQSSGYFGSSSASSSAPAFTAADIPSTMAGDVEIIEVTQDKVGQIIGSKGAIIQELQQRTGAKIYVNQNFPDGVPRQVNISGTPTQMKAASDLIKKIIAEGPTSIHVNAMSGGPQISVTIDCAQALVGRVIGSSGATIKDLQSRSGAKIQINQDFPDGVPRKINITGTQAAVSLATQLVNFVMENGPQAGGMLGSVAPMAGSGGLSMPNMGGGMGMGGMYGQQQAGFGHAPYGMAAGAGGSTTQVVDCPKPIVGRIIGKGGETINQLQQRSGTKMQVDQTSMPLGQPCKVMISGSPQNVALAVQMVNELINSNHSGGGGGMGMYGPPMGGGYMGGFNPQMYGGAMMGGGGYQPQQYGQYPHAQAYGMGSYPQQGHAAGHGGYPQQHQASANPYPVAAPVAAPAPAPATGVWSEHKTDDGNTYWYNSATGVSQWERPAGM